MRVCHWNRNVRFKIIGTFAAIEFHSHCNEMIPMRWSEADEAGLDDWWSKIVIYHSVAIAVSKKIL